MRIELNGILADANCEGHLALLLRLFQQNWRQEVWEFLSLAQVSLADFGLPPDASDREVWEACQGEQVVLVTANRNDEGPESLESTIQHHNTPQSLPVFTLANDQRVLRDRQYAETVADRLIEALFDIDSYRGTGSALLALIRLVTTNNATRSDILTTQALIMASAIPAAYVLGKSI